MSRHSALRLAQHGIDRLIQTDQGFANALNLRDGHIVNPAVAAAFESQG
ncbi:MAG: hypothetical protein WD042_09470 [Phycisphaeraceae bacterium]